MKGTILGWDVGGANVKAARLSAAGLAGLERPFALWREPERLPEVLAGIAAELGGADRMAVTLTAELADCFASKREGVARVLDSFRQAFPGTEARVYGTDGRFRSPEAARGDPHAVAAANWAASARIVAREHPHAILVDVGSTTTDIIPIVSGRVAAVGRTDPERLRSGELVYTGVLRTPVCAIVHRVPLWNGPCRVAAETFAIAADVHLWLGNLRPEEYTCETPDGRGIRHEEVEARLARIVCADPEMLTPGDLIRITQHVLRVQRQQIRDGIRQVLKRLGAQAPAQALTIGRGSFLAADAARSAGLQTVALSGEVDPAAAVALLLAEEGT